jgi:hypothetical protein
MVSFIVLQLGWFACVLGPAKGMPWLGPCVVALAIAHHLWRECVSMDARIREALILLSVTAAGFAIDTAFLHANVLVQISREPHAPLYSPFWLVALWPNFALATHRNGSLAKFATRPLLSALVGAVFGPLAYRAGAKFAPIALAEPQWRALAIVAVVWSLVLPCLFALRRRLTEQAHVA